VLRRPRELGHAERGRSHRPIITNPDDADILIHSDA
jgi:hypothetical protein